MQALRRTEVVRPVQDDPRSVGATLFGYPLKQAWDAIGGGQSDFDEPWGSLSSRERILLYCQLNQLGHLEELTEAFGQLFPNGCREEEPLVPDLGCGPFTGGLALAGVIGPGAGFDYIGWDSSAAMQA